MDFRREHSVAILRKEVSPKAQIIVFLQLWKTMEIWTASWISGKVQPSCRRPQLWTRLAMKDSISVGVTGASSKGSCSATGCCFAVRMLSCAEVERHRQRR